MGSLRGHSVTCRIAVGPNAGRRVMTLQTLAAEDPPFGEQAGHVSRPAVWETRLSLSHTTSWRVWPRRCQSHG